jgi:hypothetical protein
VTAAHVVNEAGPYFVELPSKEGHRWEVKEVVRPEVGCDVAVLHLSEELPSDGLAWPSLREICGPASFVAVVYGFPDVDPAQKQIRSATGVVIGPASPKENLALDKITELKSWRGASGSAIWVGDQIVGVLIQHDQDVPTQLHGVPIQRFWVAPWFVQDIYDPDVPFHAWNERCTIAAECVKALLNVDEVARSSIATKLSLPRTSNSAEVARCLFQSPAQVSLEALDRSDQDLFRSHRSSANTVWAILHELTPWLIDWKQVVIVARGQRDHGLELFVGPLTVAEAILAGADGRGCSFEQVDETVRGRWWITWPAAMDAVPWTNENFDAAQLQALSQRFGDARLTRAVTRLAREKKVPTHLAMENMLRNLEARLRRAAQASPTEREVWSIVIIDGSVRDGEPGHAWALLRNSELGGLLPSLKQVRVCHTDSDVGVEADAYIDAIERRHKD